MQDIIHIHHHYIIRKGTTCWDLNLRLSVSSTPLTTRPSEIFQLEELQSIRSSMTDNCKYYTALCIQYHTSYNLFIFGDNISPFPLQNRRNVFFDSLFLRSNPCIVNMLNPKPCLSNISCAICGK